MDVHNTCLVVAILSLTVSAVVIWSSFVQRPNTGAASRHDADILVILRAIHSDHSQKASPAGDHSQKSSPAGDHSQKSSPAGDHSQKSSPAGDHSHNSSIADDDAILRFVSSTHDGDGGHRNLDNYFTGGYFLDRHKYHKQYTHSYLSILPFFHDAGGRFERCLLGTAFAHKHAVPPRMTISNRLKWDTSSQGVFKFKHKFKVHYGEASFGACRSSGGRAHDAAEANRPNPGHASTSGDPSRCGHAFIMQDPIALAIADLAECVQDPGRGPLCQLIHESRSTVDDWVKARGSVVFNNILFHSDLCPNKTPDALQQPHLRFNSSRHRSPESACERIHDAFVHNLSPHTIDRLVRLITDNLQNWFSVVGIFEDLARFLTMLNHVFRFPLQECEFLSSFRDPLSSTTPPDNSRTRRGLPQNRAANRFTPPWSQESQYENMASLPNLPDDASDTASLAHALSHIENSLKWRKNVGAKTASDLSGSYKTAPGLINNNILDGDSKSGAVKYSLKQAEDNKNTVSLDKDKSLNNLFFEPDKNQNTLSNDQKENSNKLSNDQDRNQNTFSNYKDKNSKIRDTLPSNESYFEDLAGKNGSARSDESEDDRGEEEGDPSNDIASRQTSMWAAAKRRTTDTAVARLYKRFAKSVTIRQSLAADLRIYEAMKRLYAAQTRLFFNSIKLT